MGPLVGAAIAVGGIALSASKNKKIYQATREQVNLEIQQVKEQAADAALERAKAYRESISYAAALNAMGVGGATGFRGVSAASEAAFLKDMQALDKKVVFAEKAGAAQLKAAKAGKTLGNVGAVMQGVSLASNMGVFEKDAWKKPF